MVGLNTRPDILFIAYYLGQHLACPSLKHWSSAKRVLKYLKGTTDFGLVYQRQFTSESIPSLSLLGYTQMQIGPAHIYLCDLLVAIVSSLMVVLFLGPARNNVVLQFLQLNLNMLRHHLQLVNSFGFDKY